MLQGTRADIWQGNVNQSMNFPHAGRWRAGTVAVKIINHDKHVGNNFDALRESVLCSNIQHPNVVMTYKVSSRKAFHDRVSTPLQPLLCCLCPSA